MTPEELARKADTAGLRLVRFLWCGNDGTVRAKASSRHGLAARMQSGIGVSVAMNAMNGLDQLQPVAGMGPVGELRPVPDPETFRVLPYAPRTAAMLVDQHALGGGPACRSPSRTSSPWRRSPAPSTFRSTRASASRRSG